LNSFGWDHAGRAPGADDDGEAPFAELCLNTDKKGETTASGTATVLEVFRVLTKNGYRGNRTLEFHAYAAEEVCSSPI